MNRFGNISDINFAFAVKEKQLAVFYAEIPSVAVNETFSVSDLGACRERKRRKNLKKPFAQVIAASDYQIFRSFRNKILLERSQHVCRSFVEIGMLEFQIGNDERLGFHLENRTVAFVKLHNIGLTGRNIGPSGAFSACINRRIHPCHLEDRVNHPGR